MDADERVASDPGLRRALEAARSWGVSPSVMFGREMVVRHSYDDAGRLVRSTADPAWTGDDTDLALALARYEGELCPGCRSPLAETTDPENEGRYDVRVAARCHRCTQTEIVQETLQGRQQPSALLLTAVLRAPVDQGVQVPGEAGA